MEDGRQLHRDSADLSRENMIGAEFSDQHLNPIKMPVIRQDKLRSGPSAKYNSDTHSEATRLMAGSDRSIYRWKAWAACIRG